MTEADRITLLEIIKNIDLAVSFLDRDAPEAAESEKTIYAVLHALSILGEACSAVSDETKAQNPDLPWREAKDLRNRIIHGYRSVRFDVAKETINQHLPPFRSAIVRILESETDQ